MPTLKFPLPLIEVRNNKDITFLDALQLRRPFALISAPEIGPVMGLPWWIELVRHANHPCVFDCGHDVGLAVQALRAGQIKVVCQGQPQQMRALEALADLCGGHVLTSRPSAFSLGRNPHGEWQRKRICNYLETASPALGI